MQRNTNFIESILIAADIELQKELLVLKNGAVFFVSIERLLSSLGYLDEIQLEIVKNKIDKIQKSKASLLNLLNELATKMLSVRI